ncbi:MAG: hypothetical protein FJ264_02265 [Planctomycetes bacterium]|nr:hypothetical protein [Planctomycetota bacterium]
MGITDSAFPAMAIGLAMLYPIPPPAEILHLLPTQLNAIKLRQGGLRGSIPDFCNSSFIVCFDSAQHDPNCHPERSRRVEFLSEMRNFSYLAEYTLIVLLQ